VVPNLNELPVKLEMPQSAKSPVMPQVTGDLKGNTFVNVTQEVVSFEITKNKEITTKSSVEAIFIGGVLALLVIIGLAICCFCRSRKATDKLAKIEVEPQKSKEEKPQYDGTVLPITTEDVSKNLPSSEPLYNKVMSDSPSKIDKKKEYVDEEAEHTDIKTQVNRIQMIINEQKKNPLESADLTRDNS